MYGALGLTHTSLRWKVTTWTNTLAYFHEPGIVFTKGLLQSFIGQGYLIENAI